MDSCLGWGPPVVLAESVQNSLFSTPYAQTSASLLFGFIHHQRPLVVKLQ